MCRFLLFYSFGHLIQKHLCIHQTLEIQRSIFQTLFNTWQRERHSTQIPNYSEIKTTTEHRTKTLAKKNTDENDMIVDDLKL